MSANGGGGGLAPPNPFPNTTFGQLPMSTQMPGFGASTTVFGMPTAFGSSVGTTMNGVSFGYYNGSTSNHQSSALGTTMTGVGMPAHHGSVGITMAGPSFGYASGSANNPQASASCIVYKSQKSLVAGMPPNAFISPPPSCNLNEDCVICQDTLSDSPCAALNVCNHVFHYSCAQRALKSKPQCPICRKAVGAPQGKSPSGTMYISASSSRCSGYSENSIVISYAIKGGTQKSYHDNSGQRQPGKRATAYLPNNADGQSLLKRLKYAFLHGLTFTVGTSATTGVANRCTWSSIHHNTSPVGGTSSHGFPDPSYFVNCNEELDGVGVPLAHLLHHDGSEI
jgi:deltex-like protein